MGGGGGKDATSTTVQQPYGPAQGAANTLLGAAQGIPIGGQTPLAPYQVAPFNPLQNAALGGAAGAYGGATGLTDQALGQQGTTLSGAYLDPTQNPYLASYYNAASQGLVNQFQNATAPGITANALASGNLDSTARGLALGQAQYGLGQNLANLAASIYEPAYQAERGMQQQSALAAPQTATGAFAPAAQLYGFGSAGQQQQQNVLEALRQTVNQQALWPYQQMGMLQGVVSPFFGGGGSSVTVAPPVSTK